MKWITAVAILGVSVAAIGQDMKKVDAAAYKH
jgi:hypothetical protein